jgi:hypothetical protein
MDRTSSPAFQMALQGRRISGQSILSGSEPYLSLAISIEQLPRNVIGVLRAEVDLRCVEKSSRPSGRETPLRLW